MSFGPVKVFSVGMGAASTFTSAVTLPNAFYKGYLEIPTMSTAADFFLLGSTDGSNFRRVMTVAPSTSSVQVNTFTIASAATNRMVEIPVHFPYMKVEATSAPAVAATFNFICSY
jgi:hypothetical protein